MSNYLAKQMFGDKAFYGIARMAFCHHAPVDEHFRLWGGYSLVMPEASGLPESGEWQLTDSEIYVKPLRTEIFRGMKGLRVDQVLNDFHFTHPFGQCRKDEYTDCRSCDERGYKP